MGLETIYGYHIVDTDKFTKNPVIIDVGTCQGHVLDFFINHPKCKNGWFIGLEPNRTLFAELKEKYKDNKFVWLLELSLEGAPKDKTTTFYEFVGLPQWGNTTRLNVGVKPGKLKEMREYPVRALDVNRFFEPLPDTIDYLKMDIAGSEEKVFEHMFAKHYQKIKQISLELHPNISHKHIIDNLEKNGFNCVKHPHDELYAWREE